MSRKEKQKDKCAVLESINDHLNKNYLGFINYYDRLITRNLRESGIATREASSNGLWCSLILPAVLLFYNFMCDVPTVYRIVTYTALGLVFYCALFTAFLTVSSLALREQVAGGCIASSLISALLLYTFVLKELTLSIMVTMPAVFLFSYLLRAFVTRFPKTFTIGEAMIVSQSIILYIVMAVSKSFVDDNDEEMDLITAVVNTVLSTVGIIVTALSVMTESQRNLGYLWNAVIGGVLFGALLLISLQGINAVFVVLAYIFGTVKRVRLFTFWLAVSLLSIAVLAFRTKLAVKASTVTRKSFHLLASTVFLSGIVSDEELMMMAAGCGLGVLILAEALRKSGIEPISSALQSAFLVYSDEKRVRASLPSMEDEIVDCYTRVDSGTFAMTPLYLYCGLACPLLLVPAGGSGRQLELLAGVLAIGVGDTAASWFGSRYGFNKWTGSSKTVEGTAFNIMSQMSTVYALQLFSLIDAKHALLRTAIAATISGFVEALTSQVDNLVLPLVTLLTFQLTWPLR